MTIGLPRCTAHLVDDSFASRPLPPLLGLYNTDVHFYQKVLTLLFVVALVLTEVPVYAAPLAQADDAGSYTVGDCSKVDREQLRAEIERIAQQVLTDDSSRLDIAALVQRKWSERNLEGVIDAEVARATEKLGNEESYLNRLWSGWSAETAQEFATRIANDAFGAAPFKAAIDELAQAIAAELAHEIEADFARAASAALLCLKAYIGQRYSTTLYSAFESKVSVEVGNVPITTTTPVTVSPLSMHQTALGGLGAILVAELSRRLAQRLSTQIAERVAGKIVQRLLGRIGSEFIPVVGWVIGIALIAWDLWQGVEGALPEIEEALTSQEIKSKIRGEIADAVEKGLPEETAVVAKEIAVSMIEEWESFCVTRQDVCDVAGANPTFQQILNDTPIDQLDKLTNLVDSFVQYVGQAELESAISNGRLEKLLTLPESAYVILRTSKSSEVLLAWSILAGDQLDKVVELGLYRTKTPTDFDPALLVALLAVNDQAAVDKLLNFDQAELTTLVDFAGENLAEITAKTSLDDLHRLVNYLQQTTESVAATPTQLAPRLASGELTVQELLNPTVANPTAGVQPTPIITSTAIISSVGGTEPTAVRPFFDNRLLMAVAGGVALVILALLYVYTARRGQTAQAAPPPAAPPSAVNQPAAGRTEPSEVEPTPAPPPRATPLLPPRRPSSPPESSAERQRGSPNATQSSTRPPFLPPRSGSSKNRKLPPKK